MKEIAHCKTKYKVHVIIPRPSASSFLFARLTFVPVKINFRDNSHFCSTQKLVKWISLLTRDWLENSKYLKLAIHSNIFVNLSLARGDFSRCRKVWMINQARAFGYFQLKWKNCFFRSTFWWPLKSGIRTFPSGDRSKAGDRPRLDRGEYCDHRSSPRYYCELKG